MAFASLGSIGGTSTKVAGQTLAFSPSQAVTPGNLVVIWASWASDYFFGPNDLVNGVLACEDDAGNVYTSVWSVYPFVPNLCAVFVSRLTSDLTTSSTITLTHRNAGLVAKGCSGWAFSTSGSTFRWAVLNDLTVNGGSVGTDPGPLTISGLPNNEYLLLHNLTAAAPDTDAYTWDADYTQIDTFGTSGGAASSNITCLGGWRIATLTTDTVDIQSDTADRDYDQALGALREIPYSPYFPTTPLLDDFQRADQEPLPSPPWDTTADRPQVGSAQIQNLSNLAARGSAGTGGGSQYYDTTFTGPDAEVWAVAPTPGGWTIFLHGTGSGAAATEVAYGATYQPQPGSPYAGYFVAFPLAGFTGIGVGGTNPNVWGQLASNSRIGLQFDNPVVSLWIGNGGVFVWAAAYYITDAGSLLNTGRLGLAFLGDTATRVSEFGGGITVPPPTTRILLPFLHAGP